MKLACWAVVVPARVEVFETAGWQRLSSIDVPLAAPLRRQLVEVAFAGDAEHLLTSTNGAVQLWHRRRPEPEWGIIALPQCWLTIALGVALFAFAARDLLRYCSPAPVQR